jgi:hypothetical protein
MVAGSFDSYPFDREGEAKKAHSSNWDPISKEVFSNIAADICRGGVVLA